MHVGGFQALPGRSRGFGGASTKTPGAYRGLRGVQGPSRHRSKNAPCRVLPKPRTLGEAEISCGMIRPTMAGGRCGQARVGGTKRDLNALRLDALANKEQAAWLQSPGVASSNLRPLNNAA